MSRPFSRVSPAGFLAALGCLMLACSGEDPFGERPPVGTKTAAVETELGAPKQAAIDDGKAKTKTKTAVPLTHEDGKPLGKVFDDAPLPLVKMLGQTPQEAEAFLGPPLPDSKGGMRDSCVRYLPERTWFHCKFAWQRYSDKTGTFGVVHVTYEDGKVSGLAFEKIPGEGPFDPRKALRKVGLELPGEPKAENPEMDVTTWSWWNTSARLLVHERQYRVRVSTVGTGWDKAKVEIILNDALNESEKARVFDEGAEQAAAAEAGP